MGLITALNRPVSPDCVPYAYLRKYFVEWVKEEEL
jgi:hypothetical protein